MVEKQVAYKLFRVKKTEPGKIFPLFVDADNETPVGKWVAAKCGERNEKGKVLSKLGPLCYRPGWHLSDIPYVTHIGIKGSSGEIEFLNPNHVWCEVEYSSEINYQDVANQNGINKKGILIPKNAYLTCIPENGYYTYKTNPNMTGEWIIAGAIKVNRIISDKEVKQICNAHGVEPLPRVGGMIDLKALGFVG